MTFRVPVPSFLKSVRLTLGAVNGVFLLTGLLLLILGVVVFAVNKEYEDLITRKFFTVPSFVIATGVIICLTAVLGFYAALSEQFYFIAAYVILLIIILVFEVAMVIVAYGMEGNATSDITATMLTTLNQYSAKVEYAKLWDDFQMQFECCGVAGRYDWPNLRMPVSCCHIDYGQIYEFTCNTLNAYPTGCAEVLGELLSYNALVVAIAALVAMCLQVVITAMAAWMAWRSKFEEVSLES